MKTDKLTIRVEPVFKKELSELSKKEYRTVSGFIRKLVEDYKKSKTKTQL